MKSVLSPLFCLLLLQIAPHLSAQMNQAYEMAGDLVRNQLAKEDPLNQEILESIGEADIIVVDGTYDHIHRVLESLKIPFIRVKAYQLKEVPLKPFHTVFVNCASDFPEEEAHQLAEFVKSGGQLITTDWALKNVIQVAFPNTIAYEGKATQDEVVKISLSDEKDPTVLGFVEEKDNPVWWLEGSSYPIKVLDTTRVKVLVKSQELAERYGHEGVIVRFEHGKGRVYHMISHFYLQRSELNDTKKGVGAYEYLEELGADKSIQSKNKKSTVSYREVQSARTSADFVGRIIIRQAKQQRKKE